MKHYSVVPDGYPNEMYTIRNDETGETVKTFSAPGFYRTKSRAKAERDAATLNAVIDPIDNGVRYGTVSPRHPLYHSSPEPIPVEEETK